jgi:hypothetical protein
VSNKGSITCVKEKNVMEHEKNFSQVVRSENLERVVAVSLEEVLVIIRSFPAEILFEASTECTGRSPLLNECVLLNWTPQFEVLLA